MHLRHEPPIHFIRQDFLTSFEKESSLELRIRLDELFELFGYRGCEQECVVVSMEEDLNNEFWYRENALCSSRHVVACAVCNGQREFQPG